MNDVSWNDILRLTVRYADVLAIKRHRMAIIPWPNA